MQIDITNDLPAYIKDDIRAADKTKNQRIQEFLRQYKSKAKRKSTAQLLALLGFQYVYFNKPLILIVFWLSFGGMFVWWFVDLFRMAGLVKRHNHDLAISLYNNIVS